MRRAWARLLGVLVLGTMAWGCAPSGASAPGGAASASKPAVAAPTIAPAASGPATSAPVASAPAPAATQASAPTPGATSQASAPAAVAAPVKLRLGSQVIANDVAMFVAAERGHFQQAGLDVDIIPFANASEMVPALATDQLDAAGVAPNVAMWNAVARGVPMKVVLDRGTFRPGFGNQALMVRKEIYDSGRGRTMADLRGLTVGLTPPGAPTSGACALGYGLKNAGRSLDDLTVQAVTFGDMLPAMANGSIDAAIMQEPFITRLLRQGTAVKLMGQDEMYPNFTVGVVALSGRLHAERDTAKRFVRAYINASRDYNAAVAQPVGSADRNSMDQLVANFTKLDLDTVREMVPTGLNPNGAPNLDSLMYCYGFFRDMGQIPQPVSEQQIADLWGIDVVDEVLTEIGRAPES